MALTGPLAAQDDAVLQKDLWASYAKLQSAVQAADFQGFMEARIPVAPGAPQPTVDQFKAALPTLKDHYPALDSKDFIKVERDGDSAGYFFRKYDDGPSFISVGLVRFSLVQGQWKVGNTAGSSVPVDSKSDPQAQIEKILKTSKVLHLKE